MDHNNDPPRINVVADALAGRRGSDQKRIAETGINLITTLLRKNADYGSAWEPPVLCPDLEPSAALFVRMSDKISRLRTLASKSGSPEVASESINDTLLDLAGYSILAMAMPLPPRNIL